MPHFLNSNQCLPSDEPGQEKSLISKTKAASNQLAPPGWDMPASSWEINFNTLNPTK